MLGDTIYIYYLTKIYNIVRFICNSFTTHYGNEPIVAKYLHA